ncbi:hypothetical protein ACFOKI_07410 [Sphingomonas qilianensis]|uniref:Uncharacterized protein n=1 Tax=Sphingomonas qilianensis TaxID=1736690 RepID=A0ABU9XQW6_9SPHN
MSDPTRIKSNIASMIDQGATEAEIETYIASENTTAKDLRGGRMSADDEALYTALAQDPRSTADSLQGFARSRGFDVTDADAQAFIAARDRNPDVGGSVLYEPAEAPAVPEGPSEELKAQPNTAFQTVSATAGEFMDGLIPGSSKFLAGSGGALGNTIGAGLGMTDWHPGQAYDEGAADSERDQSRLEADHPNIASAAGWAGFGSSFLLPAAKVFQGGKLLAGVGNGALNGVLYGVGTGALNDTGEGRLANAVNGGALGGVLGGVAPVAARKLGDTISTARRNIPGLNGVLTAAANLPRRALGQPLIPATAAAQAQAERIINREMRDATIATGGGTRTIPATPASVATEVNRRGALYVPSMPADVSEPLRDTAAWALQGKGTMAARSRGVLADRQAQTGPRIRRHITDELGPTIDPIAEVEAIRARASAASEPGYRAAYAQPVVVTPEMARIMQTPAFRDAVPQAVRNIRNAQRDPRALGFALDPDGNIGGVETLSTEGFDQVIRAMRDNGQAAMNTSGFRPVDTTNSVHINSRARDLRGALSSQNQAYADVTANYADEMALREGLERGADVGKLSGPEIEAQRRAMPQPAQESWMVGARTALADMATKASLRPTANVAQAVRSPLGLSGAGVLSSPGDAAKQTAIETMSGRPGVLRSLDDRLGAEDDAFRTFAAVDRAGRSGGGLEETAGHLGTMVDVARKVATGRPFSALATAALRGNPKGTLRFRRDVQDHTAAILTASSPREVQRAMGALSSRPVTDQAKSGALYQRAGKLAAIGTIQAAGQSTDPVAWEEPDTDSLEAPYSFEEELRAPMYRRAR